jgi:hypothetical protein
VGLFCLGTYLIDRMKLKNEGQERTPHLFYHLCHGFRSSWFWRSIQVLAVFNAALASSGKATMKIRQYFCLNFIQITPLLVTIDGWFLIWQDFTFLGLSE